MRFPNSILAVTIIVGTCVSLGWETVRSYRSYNAMKTLTALIKAQEVSGLTVKEAITKLNVFGFRISEESDGTGYDGFYRYRAFGDPFGSRVQVSIVIGSDPAIVESISFKVREELI